MRESIQYTIEKVLCFFGFHDYRVRHWHEERSEYKYTCVRTYCSSEVFRKIT